EFPAAVENLKLACHYNPAGCELARFLAVALFRTGQTEAVGGPLERAIASDRTDTRARVMLALSQWRTGQAAAAELTLHQGLGAVDEPAAINFHLGLLAAQAEQWGQVEQYLTKCVAVDEGNAQAWRYLGLACGAQGKAEAAAANLRRAQRLAPADPHVALELAYASAAANAAPMTVRKLNLAELTAAPADMSEDLDRLARAIMAEPEFIQAFLDLPASPMDQQIFGVLSFSLKRAAAARPTYADLHYYISRVNRRLGLISQAIDSAEQAIALNPKYVAALIHAAGLYHQTAQRGASAQRLRAAIAAGGDYPDVHLVLGHLYRELGQTPEARRSYERALRLKPHYAAAKEALAALAA
ncbi:MAG: tetratricopeptide repeat protein, partial [Phycisphaerae bacterium]|nr:tetratricopeptide repeat protein [Phycisphaerae bacterium]